MYIIAYFFCLIIRYAKYADNLFRNVSNEITKIYYLIHIFAYFLVFRVNNTIIISYVWFLCHISVIP